MTDSVHMYSMNARGLGDHGKRVQVFSWLHNRPADIFFLQETHSTAFCEKKWKDDWGNNNIFFSHGTSNSTGVAILLSNNMDFKIMKEHHDDDGRVIILDVTINDDIMTIINIYGPNVDDPIFFDSINMIMRDFTCETIVIGGDFNCLQDVTIDKKGGRTQTHENSQRSIYRTMEEYDLIDIWRKKNPNVKRYTWRSNTNPPIMCRLDYFLISYSLYTQIEQCNISPGFKTDHSSIDVKIESSNDCRGRGFWKFNVSLLNDIEYVNKIKKCIHEVNTNCKYMNPDMLWDFLKCEIRTISIEYSINISKTRKKEESRLVKNINDLESRYSINPTNDLSDEIKQRNADLETLYKVKTKGCIVRSRANHIEFGERNSKYFINLEKRNQKRKVIKKLMLENGDVLTDSDDILNAEKHFYEQLYTSCEPDDCNLNDLLVDINATKLDNEAQMSCEGRLSIKECSSALRTMPNNKTPGSDGLPTEFYKFFFNDIIKNLIDSFDFSFRNGRLSADQRRGIINLIPKPDKDPSFLKNWRPISLLNTDYKLLTKCIANRLKIVLPDIIHSDQTGFLPGRYIGENVRLALDMIDHLNKNDLPGLMFLIDFRKAFDKIEWSFILKTLTFFNFGPDLIKWVKVIYTDISSCVINNGNSSSFFNLGCGVRQGCPLSPLLYIICSEVLSLLIKNDKDINGIMVNDNIITISAYADDTVLYLNDVNSLRKAIQILNRFQKYSGLAINLDKSELLALGSFRDNPPDITDTGLIFCNSHVKLLGIIFNANLDNLFELNFVPKIEKLKTILGIWSMRDMTPIGRISIIKSLGLSQMIYLLSVLPNPNDVFLKNLDTIVYKFIWSNKPDKVSRKTVIAGYYDGGLNMMHIPSMIKGLKIAWVKRLLDDKNKGNWKCFYKKELAAFGGNLIWYCNLNPSDNSLKNIKNKFIYEVITAWFHVVYTNHDQNYHHEILWNNSRVRIANRVLFWKNWYDKGLKCFKDMLSFNGDILNLTQFKHKFNMNINFLDYFSLVDAIPQKWKRAVKTVKLDDNTNSQEKFVLKITNVKQVCKLVHKKCTQRIIKTPVSELKWADHFNEWDLNWRDVYLIPLIATLSTRIRYFQYKILHRYLAVNKLLKKMGIVNSELCTFCNLEIEDIQHFFWNCSRLTTFWNEFQNCILRNSFDLNARDIILGFVDIDKIKYNFILLFAKYYIYNCKWDNSKPNYMVFVRIMKTYKDTENFIAVKNNTVDKWRDRWNGVYL